MSPSIRLDPYRKRGTTFYRMLDGSSLVGGVTPAAAPVFGVSCGVPYRCDDLPEVDIYRGLSKEQMFDVLSGEFGVVPKLFHGYDSGIPSNIMSGTDVDWALARGIPVVSNLHAGDTALSSGSMNSALQAYCNSVPADATVWAVMNHEPSNDAGYNPTAWRAGMAKFAEQVILHRGTKKIHPTICVINWDISSKNVAGAANYEDQNPAPEMTALGVDLDQVVYTTDGYDVEPIAAGGARNLYESTSARARSWGFKRFGVSEGACKTYTDADRTLGPTWINNMRDVAYEFEFEYFAWFNSGIGNRVGVEGWYLYGQTNKTAYGNVIASSG